MSGTGVCANRSSSPCRQSELCSEQSEQRRRRRKLVVLCQPGRCHREALELVLNSYGQPSSDKNTGIRSTEVETISSGWTAGVFSAELKKKGSSVSLGNVGFFICAETLIHPTNDQFNPISG